MQPLRLIQNKAGTPLERDEQSCAAIAEFARPQPPKRIVLIINFEYHTRAEAQQFKSSSVPVN
jgi:hypothetical protein